MTLLLLLACSASTTDTGTVAPSTTDGGSTTTTTTDTGTVAWVSPDLPLLADAEDLDPADGQLQVDLVAAAATHTIEGPDRTLEISGWAYNGGTPGPTIRAQLGDTVTVNLDNQLGTDTTIHWHGLDVPWEMDGVTWMQDPVADGSTFTYSFVVNQSGTFWYHPHFDTERQVDLGLYGAMVVEDPAQPAADVDAVLVLDDWRPIFDTEGTDLDPSDADQAHGAHGSEGLWTVNGVHQPTMTVPAGSAVRLRLINVSNTGYIDLRQEGLRVIAQDQGLLPAADSPDGLLLGPGDRAELELSVGSDAITLWDAPYDHQGGAGFGDAVALLTVQPEGSADAPAQLALPFPGGDVAEDPGRTDVLYVFSGDTGTGDWFMNGEQFPDVTVQAVPLDGDAVIEVRNISPTVHPFHLHGHSFEVLSVDGVAPTQRRVEDTLNLELYETVRLALLADNPGDWMAHCHILPHAEGGMMSVLRVQ